MCWGVVCAHMPYFRRPGHICGFTIHIILQKVNRQIQGKIRFDWYYRKVDIMLLLKTRRPITTCPFSLVATKPDALFYAHIACCERHS